MPTLSLAFLRHRALSEDAVAHIFDRFLPPDRVGYIYEERVPAADGGPDTSYWVFTHADGLRTQCMHCRADLIASLRESGLVVYLRH